MKHFFLFCAIIAGVISASAQTVIDNFNVGPYVVDYNGQGDVRYRLRDDVNLYEFFELKMDTTIISMATEEPVRHAIQISGRFGVHRYSPKEYALEGVWKQNIGKNLYFNGGLSLAIGYAANAGESPKRTMLEVGVPLQIELGKLNHQYASVYGNIGIAPTFYSTLSATVWDSATHKRVDDIKKSGFLIAPSLELGANVPVGNVILRMGVYGIFKVNCTTSDYDVYKGGAGRTFIGVKIGVVL